MKSYFKIVSKNQKDEEIHFSADSAAALHIVIPENIQKFQNNLRNKAGSFRVLRNVYVDQNPQIKGSKVEWMDSGYSF